MSENHGVTPEILKEIEKIKEEIDELKILKEEIDLDENTGVKTAAKKGVKKTK